MNFIENTIAENLAKRFPDQTEFYPKTVIALAEQLGIKRNDAYRFVTSQPKVRRGVYNLQSVVNGDIQEFIDELQLAENAEKLKEGTSNE